MFDRSQLQLTFKPVLSSLVTFNLGHSNPKTFVCILAFSTDLYPRCLTLTRGRLRELRERLNKEHQEEVEQLQNNAKDLKGRIDSMQAELEEKQVSAHNLIREENSVKKSDTFE